ncbi:hypothetical protein GCM10023144_38810 [Pigmentiphaga soli]|uniref:Uncharacterized protein n=1 Tax=Pigmentiphaga soli TaxID=1007095 RepID=A0ABP8HJA5_9BURK
MSIDRKAMVCFVVAAKGSDGAWRWGALNEDRQWLMPLHAEEFAAGEKAGVLCCKTDDLIRQVAIEGLGMDSATEVIVHRLFQASDSDDCAAVISRKVRRRAA